MGLARASSCSCGMGSPCRKGARVRESWYEQFKDLGMRVGDMRGPRETVGMSRKARPHGLTRCQADQSHLQNEDVAIASLEMAIELPHLQTHRNRIKLCDRVPKRRLRAAGLDSRTDASSLIGLKLAAQVGDRCAGFMGWSNNHFKNLHFKLLPETNETTTCVAEPSLMCCDFLTCRLLNYIKAPT